MGKHEELIVMIHFQHGVQQFFAVVANARLTAVQDCPIESNLHRSTAGGELGGAQCTPLRRFVATADIATSENGTLIYRTGSVLVRQLVWLDRLGTNQGAVAELDRYGYSALAPDGVRIAAGRYDAQTNQDIWLLDSSRKTRTRFAFGRFRLNRPLWSPD